MLIYFKELIKMPSYFFNFSRWAIVTFGMLLASMVTNGCLIRKCIRGTKNSRILIKRVASLEQMRSNDEQMKPKIEPASSLPRFSYRPAPLPPVPTLNSMGLKATVPSTPRSQPLDGASASFPDEISFPAANETEDKGSEDAKI